MGVLKIIKIKDDKKKEKVVSFLRNYKVNSYIYPSVLEKKLKLSKEEANSIIDDLMLNNYIRPIYSLFCTGCQKIVSGPCVNLEEIPKETICDYCDNTINSTDYIKSYEVLHVIE